ncbi:MAG: transporter substrate-binding domain-containing protein [Desulfobacterales bacterium]|nr:transporter substrate-binding domain-containing protein [Desulfobacterales bacterium]
MIRKSILFLFCLLVLIPAQAGAMEMVSGEIPPYSSEKEGEQGIALDIVKAVFDKAGMDLNITFKPWARSQHLVQTAPEGKGLLIAPLTRTANREALYEWIIPLVEYKLQMVTNDPGVPVNDEAAMKKLKVCALRSAPAEYKLQEMGYAKVDAKNTELKCFQLLKAKRVKGVLCHGFLLGVHNYKQFGGDPSELIKGVSYPGGTIYLAASKGTVDDATKARLEKALGDVKADGTYDAIINRYAQ